MHLTTAHCYKYCYSIINISAVDPLSPLLLRNISNEKNITVT